MTQRRGNGLLAEAYVPLILLVPSHADLMLEALRRSGIAAYAIPLEEDVLEPSGSEADTPPTDHLYVDAEERPAAERVLGVELPEIGVQENGSTDLLAPRGEPLPDTDEEENGGTGGGGDRATAHEATESPSGGDLLDGPPDNVDPDAEPVRPSDEDEVWNDLVARFYDEHEETSDQRRRVAWPDAENLSAPDEREDESGPSRIGDLLSGRSRKERDDVEDGEAAEEEARRRAEAEIEGHYEPPPPSPLIQGDRVGIAAWFGLLSAPVILFGAAFLSISLPNWLMLLLVLAFLGSFVVLVLRMTDNRPPGDDGPDNGAVV